MAIGASLGYIVGVPEQEPLPPKVDVARLLLTQGSVFIHLDPRSDSVVVPPWYRREPQLVLQVGFEMPVPIPDLRIDAEGVYGTLSFNRSPFTCHVGWDAVFALAGEDGRGMVWPDSMPDEISQEIEREAGRKGVEPPTGADKARVVEQPQAKLKVVPVSDEEDAQRPPRDQHPTRRFRRSSRPPARRDSRNLPPYLKVIK